MANAIRGVVQTQNEQCTVNDVQTVTVVGAFVLAQYFAQARPYFAVLGAQHTECTFGSILNRGLFGIIDDSLQICADVSFRHDQIVVIVQHVEPVELSLAQDNEVFAVRILADLASIVCGNASCTEQTRVLVHAQWLSSKGVWWEFFLPYSSGEGQGRYDERSRTRDLVVASWCRVVFQEEEWVEVENDRVVEVEVRVVP